MKHDSDVFTQPAPSMAGVQAENPDVAGGAKPVSLQNLDGGRLTRAVGSKQAKISPLLTSKLIESTARKLPYDMHNLDTEMTGTREECLLAQVRSAAY